LEERPRESGAVLHCLVVGRFGTRNAGLHVIVATVLVHQEANGAQLHAEHRLAQVPVPVQGLQHETVATQRAQHVGLLGRVIAITRDHRRAGHLCRFGGAGQESDAGGVAHQAWGPGSVDRAYLATAPTQLRLPIPMLPV
jgi:hypothetical protein